MLMYKKPGDPGFFASDIRLVQVFICHAWRSFAITTAVQGLIAISGRLLARDGFVLDRGLIFTSRRMITASLRYIFGFCIHVTSPEDQWLLQSTGRRAALPSQRDDIRAVRKLLFE